jgi:Tfp pilus assembly protein PilW
MRHRPDRQPEADSQRGETLLELLVAITILGVCIVAIGGAVAASVTLSAVHRDQATAQDSLHNYAEILQNSYTPCTATTIPPYAQRLAQIPTSGFSVPAVVVDYWIPASAAFTTTHTCPAAGDTGLQQVGLTLVSTSGKVSESLVFDVRSSS